MGIYGIDGNCLFAGATFSSSSLSPPILIIRTKNSSLWALRASGRLLQKSDICAGGSAETCVSVKLALVCEFHKHLPSEGWSVCLSRWLWVAACENTVFLNRHDSVPAGNRGCMEYLWSGALITIEKRGTIADLCGVHTECHGFSLGVYMGTDGPAHSSHGQKILCKEI